MMTGIEMEFAQQDFTLGTYDYADDFLLDLSQAPEPESSFEHLMAAESSEASRTENVFIEEPSLGES